MSVPCEGYSRNVPICWVWAFLMKDIPETFQSVEHERSLWRLFQKLSNLLSMSVPCEDYSRNFPICWVWAFLVKAILETFQSVEYERSLWRLFQKLSNLLSMSVPCEGYSGVFQRRVVYNKVEICVLISTISELYHGWLQFLISGVGLLRC